MKTTRRLRKCINSAIERLEPRHLLSAAALPRPDHVVVVVEEDHSYGQILGQYQDPTPMTPSSLPNPLDQAPYLWQLAQEGASFTNAHAVANKNQTNYQALLSGIPPQKNPDHPLENPAAPNLAQELIAAGLSFGGYAESLPSVGYVGGDTDDYKQEHNPWVALNTIPAADNRPFSSFPRDFNALPTVSFVVPNEGDNMHSGEVVTADNWLHDNLGDYAKWAMHHNSLLIVTWDESHQPGDSIPVIFYGAGVEKGQYAEPITQYNILSTLEGMYGLSPTGLAAGASPITDTFSTDTRDVQDLIATRQPNGDGSISGLVSVSRPASRRTVHRTARTTRWHVYVDSNGNGIYDPGERFAITSRSGRFNFDDLGDGTYVIRVAPKAGYAIVPGTADQEVIGLANRQDIKGIHFSQRPIP